MDGLWHLRKALKGKNVSLPLPPTLWYTRKQDMLMMLDEMRAIGVLKTSVMSRYWAIPEKKRGRKQILSYKGIALRKGSEFLSTNRSRAERCYAGASSADISAQN